ncbi:unnamed protein product [Calypogeia fissa]
MGMEIPATKEVDEEEEEEYAQSRSANLPTQSEQSRAMKADEEDEDEETEEDDEEEDEEDGEIVEAAEGGEQHGNQQQQRTTDEARELRTLKARPSVLVVGSPAVGKRSLVSRLIARGRSVKVTSETGAIGHGWTIDTKYYTANVTMWMARLGHPTLEDIASINSEFGRCEALVMVFDLSNPTSFEELQEWATKLDLGNFEILLCIGNKADRVPEHFAHAEYRRKVQKRGESSSDPHPEFWDFGISRTDGTGLLEEESVSAEDRRRSCIEWCSDNGFEYIEACAIDEIFDECMTVDGDLQGVARIDGALSAHMWPGLVMKDGNESNDTRSKLEQEVTSDDDSDYYIEYELLSNGSAEPWEASGWEEQWSFSTHVDEPAPETSGSHSSSSATQTTVRSDLQHDSNAIPTHVSEVKDRSTGEVVPTSQIQSKDVEMLSDESVDHPVVQNGFEVLSLDRPEPNGHKNHELEDMEQLMSEMASMRMNMRSMSDQHRREMAARLALRMASMFKEDESGESDVE